MIKSMTGYGNASLENEQLSINVEVKTLNSKFLDFSFRAPRQFSEKEKEVRNIVQNTLERGKVAISLDITSKSSGQLPVQIDEELFKTYYNKYKELAVEVGDSSSEIFKMALQSPNVTTNIASDSEDLESEWVQILEVIKEALSACASFREDEGKALEVKLSENVGTIREGLDAVKGLEGERVEKIKSRIRGHFDEWLEEQQFDANRFEQELIYYFEKLDITEEIVRLGTHLDYFEKTMKEGKGQGKKLGFISQEMGREINTIGSKANDAQLQKHVILMKDELEKIKEQTLNVL
ncbi:YicC/YloC family endoribonuclease [Algoriphagus sediminis]|uniref:YicC/YloC family endoribonuclease n=1 Tax=Algoriphagus sediminis TaxID=3057113 RepID=A0ABT7Y8K0_9BACT|nr:YicC/YloC family endoribonuclease [Algoriphagus sediminis]MDN3202842.1 YicC/YloC family endoribonuclease [Algoriphagus sediminis]